MMPWIKGVARGPQSPAHLAKIKEAQSRAQKARWQDPDKRALALAGCHKSWDTGGRAKDRVHWTSEMDAELIRLWSTLKSVVLIEVGPSRVGVGSRLMWQRLTDLRTAGIIGKKPWLGRKPTFDLNTPCPRKSPVKSARPRLRSLDSLYRELGLK
jgi:hypothetical protein